MTSTLNGSTTGHVNFGHEYEDDAIWFDHDITRDWIRNNSSDATFTHAEALAHINTDLAEEFTNEGTLEHIDPQDRHAAWQAHHAAFHDAEHKDYDETKDAISEAIFAPMFKQALDLEHSVAANPAHTAKIDTARVTLERCRETFADAIAYGDDQPIDDMAESYDEALKAIQAASFAPSAAEVDWDALTDWPIEDHNQAEIAASAYARQIFAEVNQQIDDIDDPSQRRALLTYSFRMQGDLQDATTANLESGHLSDGPDGHKDNAEYILDILEGRATFTVMEPGVEPPTLNQDFTIEDANQFAQRWEHAIETAQISFTSDQARDWFNEQLEDIRNMAEILPQQMEHAYMANAAKVTRAEMLEAAENLNALASMSH